MLFLVCVNAEDNKDFQCHAYVKCFKRNIFNAYVQSRTLHTHIGEIFVQIS